MIFVAITHRSAFPHMILVSADSLIPILDPGCGTV